MARVDAQGTKRIGEGEELMQYLIGDFNLKKVGHCNCILLNMKN